jgi:hypothetical protein
VITAAAFASSNGIFSAGELRSVPGDEIGGVRSHADLSRDCGACHPAFWSDGRMGETCLGCHEEVAAELDDPSKLHGGIAGPDNCMTCHTEHEGPEAALTDLHGAAFPHDRFGFSLYAHQDELAQSPLACRDCHTGSVRRFEVQDCAECHFSLDLAYAGEHMLAFGPGCLECHDGLDSYGADWDHNAGDFPLIGAHSRIPCSRCHLGVHTIDALQATPDRCIDCHREDDIHQGRLGADCGECHGPETWEEASIDHDRTGFALLASHAEIECLDCHAGRQWAGIPRDCYGCHSEEDRHQGRFGQECGLCHRPTEWSDWTFEHAVVGFPLEFSHALAECEGCHVNGRYAGTPRDCFSCHADDDHHGGRFGEECGLCHRPTSWSDWTFDHARSNFPLTGAHARVACESCHPGGRFEGTPSACGMCHAEPALHAGVFGVDCGACHSTSAWRPASWNGPHPFPMNHGGAGGSCRTCHPGSYASYSCYSCHNQGEIADKHREVGDFSNCVACHPTGNEEEGGDD